MFNQIITLATGASIPMLGAGTWQTPNGDAHRVVLEALEMGYRLIECVERLPIPLDFSGELAC